MKRILLSLLVVVLALGALGAVGFAGYRFGYARGVHETVNGPLPEAFLFDDISPRGMPNRGPHAERGFGFNRGFGPGRFDRHGFGFFSFFGLLIPLMLLGILVLFAYWLFSRSGWRLTRTVQATRSDTPPATTASTGVEEEQQP